MIFNCPVLFIQSLFLSLISWYQSIKSNLKKLQHNCPTWQPELPSLLLQQSTSKTQSQHNWTKAKCPKLCPVVTVRLDVHQWMKQGRLSQWWKRKNHHEMTLVINFGKIKTWLINSIENEISHTFFFYKTAKELWDVVRFTYSDTANTSEQFNLEKVMINLKQGDMDITTYFNTLSVLATTRCFWGIRCERQNDHQKYKKIVKENVFFLSWMDSTRILMSYVGESLPSATTEYPEVFSTTRWEECRKVMWKDNSATKDPL